MLIQMYPDQISSQWDVLWPAIEAALPETAVESDSNSANILESMLLGIMQCWVYKEESKIIALVTTAITEDIGTRTRNLLIYSLYGYRQMTDDIVNSGLRSLKLFASKKKCANVIAYTNFKRVIDMFSDGGGKVSSTLLSMKVNGVLEDENIHKS